MERLFYDKSSYTGVHKNGGPTTGRRDSSGIDLTRYLDRSPADKRGVKVPEKSPKPTNARARFEHKLKQMQSSTKSWAMTGNADLLKTTPSLASTASLPQIKMKRSESSHEMACAKGHAGPERLFYDTHSYTGVHRNGGPTTVEANLVESSYHFDRSASDIRGVKVEQKQRRGPKTTQEKLEDLRTGWQGLGKGLLRSLPSLAASERLQSAQTPYHLQPNAQARKQRARGFMRNKMLSKSMGCLPDVSAESEDISHDDSNLLAPPSLKSPAPDLLALPPLSAAALKTSSCSTSVEVSSCNTSVDDSLRSGNSTAKGSEGMGALEQEQELEKEEEEQQTGAIVRENDGVKFCVLLREEAQKDAGQPLVCGTSERKDMVQPLVSVTSFKLSARPPLVSRSRAGKID